MLTVFGMFIFGADNPNPIQMGATPLIIGLRVMVSIMMHLQVEEDTRQGLNMMKYLVNHPEDFTSPIIAYMVGLAQVLTGVLCEIACVCYLGTIQNPISVMISYMALGAVARVDDMYAGALDAANRIKGESKPFDVKNHRRDVNARSAEFGFGFFYFFGRVIYKTLRVLYSSYHYYFFPYTALIICYGANYQRN